MFEDGGGAGHGGTQARGGDRGQPQFCGGGGGGGRKFLGRGRGRGGCRRKGGGLLPREARDMTELTVLPSLSESLLPEDSVSLMHDRRLLSLGVLIPAKFAARFIRLWYDTMLCMSTFPEDLLMVSVA